MRGSPLRHRRLLNLRVGPRSDVRLDTTYVGERLRISRGGRSGTPFIFDAAGAAQTPAADAWRDYEALSELTARAASRRLWAVAAALLAAAAFDLARGAAGGGRCTGAAAAAVVAGLLAAALGKSTGGIVVDTTGDGSGGAPVLKTEEEAKAEREIYGEGAAPVAA